MRRRVSSLLMTVLCCLWVLVLPALAGEQKAAIVDDQAGLLSSIQRSTLLTQAQQIARQYNCDVMALTTSDPEGKTSGSFAEEYFLAHCTGDDGFILIIDMYHREINVRTSGEVIRILDDAREEQLLDDGFDQVSRGEYAATFQVMLGDMSTFLKAGVPTVPETAFSSPGKLLPAEALVGAAAGVILALICFLSVARRYRMKSGTYRYQFNENMKLQLTQKENILQNRFVTTRHIPRNPPGGSPGGHSTGGGAGHYSTVHTGAGGHTFGGGGGRRF